MAKKDKEEVVQPLDEESQKPAKGRGRAIAIGAVLGVMIVEALVIFVLAKGFVAPEPRVANAGESGALDPAAGQKAPEPVEVEIVKLRAQNERSQRVMVYDFSVFVVVSGERQGEFTRLLDTRRETIRDRFTRIVRSSDPARFQEPDLTTLRTQFKHELNQVLGKGDLVEEVLIPTIMSYAEG
ncbi:MAG TPA: flagellar basal body-associated FliL family protein [Phycisphaerae bacterium]|nr:flagellar basal body-associated FliL family protein [Phycisphaerae bacterium]